MVRNFEGDVKSLDGLATLFKVINVTHGQETDPGNAALGTEGPSISPIICS